MGHLRKPRHHVEQDSSDIPTPTTLLELSEFLTGKEIRCRLLFFVVLPIDVIDVKTDELKHSIYTCCHDGECVFPFLLSAYPFTCAPSRLAYTYYIYT